MMDSAEIDPVIRVDYDLWAKATSSGSRKLKQYMSLFGATRRTKCKWKSGVEDETVYLRYSLARCNQPCALPHLRGSVREWVQETYLADIFLGRIVFELAGKAVDMHNRQSRLF